MSLTGWIPKPPQLKRKAFRVFLFLPKAQNPIVIRVEGVETDAEAVAYIRLIGYRVDLLRVEVKEAE